MQGGRDPFFGFGDPFAGFGGYSGFGRQRRLISEVFGGRDLFDDPFFRSPFGGMLEPGIHGSIGGPFMNPHASGFLEHQPPHPNMPDFLGPNGGPFMNPHASGFHEHRPPHPNMSRGPVIEELSSDDEKDEKESGNIEKENPKKHGRSSKDPIVEDPDDEATEKKSKHMARWNDMNQMQRVKMQQPQVTSFTFQSSSVSYGGANGVYYTTSSTKRTGSDGLTYEEFKEADSSTHQATHRVVRGIHNKGHSVTRKLKSDGNVDTIQTLHNLNQDELPCFEEAWRGNAKKHLPGWSEESASRDAMRSGRIGDRGAWELPCIESSNNAGSVKPDIGGTRVIPQHAGSSKPDVRPNIRGMRVPPQHAARAKPDVRPNIRGMRVPPQHAARAKPTNDVNGTGSSRVISNRAGSIH